MQGKNYGLLDVYVHSGMCLRSQAFKTGLVTSCNRQDHLFELTDR